MASVTRSFANLTWAFGDLERAVKKVRDSGEDRNSDLSLELNMIAGSVGSATQLANEIVEQATERDEGS